MILAAVSIVAIATSALVVMVSHGRFTRRRATVVALTAAIAKVDVQPRREPGRRTRVLASRAITAGPNVFALDEYRRMRNARRPAPLPALFEATPRSLA